MGARGGGIQTTVALSGELNTHHYKNILLRNQNKKPRDRVMDNEHWNRAGQHGLRIGTWNVRTLYKVGALQTLTEVVEKYNIPPYSITRD